MGNIYKKIIFPLERVIKIVIFQLTGNGAGETFPFRMGTEQYLLCKVQTRNKKNYTNRIGEGFEVDLFEETFSIWK